VQVVAINVDGLMCEYGVNLDTGVSSLERECSLADEVRLGLQHGNEAFLTHISDSKVLRVQAFNHTSTVLVKITMYTLLKKTFPDLCHFL
jgi:hypothetical protein